MIPPNARQARVVETCLAPLLAWSVSLGHGTPRALALDATTVGTRLTGLVLRVVYRGCAIPSVWTVWPATATPAWRREWWRRRRPVRRAVPPTWPVIVLADRGRYARWLVRRITRLGWPPCGRINTGGTCPPQGQVRGRPRKTLVPQSGTSGAGPGIALKGRPRQLPCAAGTLGVGRQSHRVAVILTDGCSPERHEAC